MTGCEQEYVRPYLDHENNMFQSIKLPPSNATLKFRKYKNPLKINKPLPAVWSACLEIATQGSGVLSIDSNNPKQRRLMFVASEPFNYEPEVLQKFAGRIQRDYVEIWLSVVVTELDERTTEVASWWIDPETGRLFDYNSYSTNDDRQFYAKIAT